jgi:peroxiredoxin Q/BCP
MSKPVEVGDRAPVFSLPSESGDTANLADYIWKKHVVLFFYPKDNTIVCTKEACAFRDNYDEFRRLEDTELFGISADPVESHQNFSSQHGLPFRLLCDEKGAVNDLYGVPKTLGIFPGRVTYVIDRDGIVIKIIFSQLDYKKHVEEALVALRSSQNKKI